MKNGQYHNILHTLFSLAISQAAVFDGVSPFGVCIVLAADPDNLYAVLGSLLGAALVQGAQNKLLYAACMVIAFAVRRLSGLTPRAGAWLAAILLGVGRGVTLYALGDLYIWPEALFADMILGALYTRCFGLYFACLKKGGNFYRFARQNEVAAALCLAVLMFVPRIFIGKTPAALYLAVVLVLALSRRQARPGGVLSACFFGSALSLLSGSGAYMVQLILGAVAAGTMQGKVRRALAFMCAFLAGGVLFGKANLSACLLGGFGASLYLLMPSHLYDRFYAPTDRHRANYAGVLKSAASCLCYAADVSREVALKDPALQGDSGYQQAAETVCKRCPERDSCFGEKSADTLDCLHKAYLSSVGGTVVFAPHFVCARRLQMADALYRAYASRLQQKAAARAFLTVKEQCAGALSATGAMLSAIAAEEDTTVSLPNGHIADRAAGAAKGLGYHVDDCLAETSEGRGLCITLSIVEPITSARAWALIDRLEDLLDIPFDVPTVTRSGGVSVVRLCQKAPLSLTVAVRGHGTSATSGDRFAHFCGSDGLTYLLLCDGMGTGARGAAFGSYTAIFLQKILQGGIPKGAGVDLLSHTLPLGCGMEGLSTVDLLGFNAFTGKSRLTKAGAEQTILLTSRGTSFLGHPSTPVGYGSTGTWEGETLLREGDIVLMHSDGIPGGTVLQNLLWQNRFCTPDKIAQIVLQSAADSRDDCTVVAARVAKNKI